MAQPRKIKKIISEEQTQRIACQIKILRKKSGFTQAELGEKIGVTQKAIAAYESGRVRILDLTLIDLARALNVSVDKLLGVKPAKTTSKEPSSLRLIKRMNAIDELPEAQKKYILRTIDLALENSKMA